MVKNLAGEMIHRPVGKNWSNHFVARFLFSCRRWTCQRREMDIKCPGKEGNARFFLGAKGPQDDKMWTPNMSAIQATICFVKSTKRFEEAENV